MPDVRKAWPQLLRRCYRATQAANLRDGSFCRREHGASCNYGCRRGIPMGNRIVSIIWVTAFALAASGFAFAADMAVKAPPPAPAPVYNWTGWYVGLNAGASFGNVKTDFNVAPVFAENPNNVPGPIQLPPGFGASDRNYPSGFIGGGQIGYNWQYSPLIFVGLEADIQGALEKETDNNVVLVNNFGFGNPGLAESGGIPPAVVANYTT